MCEERLDYLMRICYKRIGNTEDGMLRINTADETLSDLSGVTVTRELDGTVTIRGLDGPTLGSLLTQIKLHQHDNQFKPEVIPENADHADVRKENAEASRDWHWQMADIVAYLEAELRVTGSEYSRADSYRAKESLAAERKWRIKDTERHPAWLLSDAAEAKAAEDYGRQVVRDYQKAESELAKAREPVVRHFDTRLQAAMEAGDAKSARDIIAACPDMINRCFMADRFKQRFGLEAFAEHFPAGAYQKGGN